MMIYVRIHPIRDLMDAADKHQWIRFTAGGSKEREVAISHSDAGSISPRTPHPSPRTSTAPSPGGRTTLGNRLALQGINEATAVNTHAQSAQNGLGFVPLAFRLLPTATCLLETSRSPLVEPHDLHFISSS